MLLCPALGTGGRLLSAGNAALASGQCSLGYNEFRTLRHRGATRWRRSQCQIGLWIRFRGCCCSMRPCARSIRRYAKKTSASGRPGTGSGCGRGAGPCRRPGRTGFSPRRQSCHHRRQPAAPVLGHDSRRRCLGGIPVPHVPGRGGAGTGVRAAGCRHPLRRRRGPGTGGQADRVPWRAPPASNTFCTTIRAACAITTRPFCAASTRCRSRGASRIAKQAGFHRQRNRAGQGRRRRDHALHLRHHRQAEGRVHHPFRADQRSARRLRLRPA